MYHLNDRRSFGYVVGLQPGDPRAGPWELTAGRTVAADGEAVIPAALARLAGTGIGDTVAIADRRFEVVGLSAGTYSAANTVIFVTMADIEDMLSLGGAYSFLLVDAEEGVDAGALAARIRSEVEKVNAVTQEEFIRNDFAMAMQMGVEIIVLMTVISGILAALIVAFTASSLVMRGRRELAVAKALGVKNGSILVAVVLQATAVTVVGCAIAIAFVLVVIPWIPVLVPQLTLALSIAAAARVAVIAVFVAAAGAMLPGYLVAAVDPATAFHRWRNTMRRSLLAARSLSKTYGSGATAVHAVNDVTMDVADEPTGNLDSHSGQDVMMILHDIARDERRAVVFVTHDPRVEDIADRILWLEDGALRDRKAQQHAWITDPVCGMRIDEWTAVFSSEHAGRRYTFCSKRCQERFTSSPDVYTSTAGG